MLMVVVLPAELLLCIHLKVKVAKSMVVLLILLVVVINVLMDIIFYIIAVRFQTVWFQSLENVFNVTLTMFLDRMEYAFQKISIVIKWMNMEPALNA